MDVGITEEVKNKPVIKSMFLESGTGTTKQTWTKKQCLLHWLKSVLWVCHDLWPPKSYQFTHHMDIHAESEGIPFRRSGHIMWTKLISWFVIWLLTWPSTSRHQNLIGLPSSFCAEFEEVLSKHHWNIMSTRMRRMTHKQSMGDLRLWLALLNHQLVW